MRRRMILAFLAAAVSSGASAHAATCSKDDFAQAVDRAGAQLRQLNGEQTPRLQVKIRKLKEAKGWPDTGFEEKAYELLQDERIAAYDAQANDLLGKIDALGTFEPTADAECGKLDELTAASLELQATVKAKAEYTLSKLDQMLGEGTTPEPKRKVVEAPRKPLPAPAKPEAKSDTSQSQQQAKGPATGSWSTQTQGKTSREADASRDGAVVEPSATDQYVPPLTADEEGYSIQEIMAASEGLFGKVSANLASVIEHLFRKSGRPTAYVLGTEGGGAFLAGVRYGKGLLYLRSGSTQKIYWHGPSIGTDVGGDGSKTLFLIYKLSTADQLYANFTGIDGSAYFVGGVGATLVGNGHVIMAPIRSGLGLRLGANIGYIRFTSHSTWNPF